MTMMSGRDMMVNMSVTSAVMSCRTSFGAAPTVTWLPALVADTMFCEVIILLQVGVFV